MKTTRSVNFLPEIFKTPTNKKFLSSTLDQLIQEPELKQWQGYIGRKRGIEAQYTYVNEPTTDRFNYQLEPSVVFGGNSDDVMPYTEILDALAVQRGNIVRHDRLFESESYAWDSFIDMDKFVNFSQYFWMPGGPDAVSVSASEVPSTRRFRIRRTADGYTVDGEPGINPPLTVIRGGSYEFEVDQTDIAFWIQGFPGIGGMLPYAPNLSSRDILGVANNGEDVGIILFEPPSKDAQSFYHDLALRDDIDLITTTDYNQIHNRSVASVMAAGGIDGVMSSLDGLTIVFLPEAGGWADQEMFDTADYDASLYAFETEISLASQRAGVWRIEYDYTVSSEGPFIKLVFVEPIATLTKWQIQYGTNAYAWYYKDALGVIQRVPFLSATMDSLYYQDDFSDVHFGEIKLIESSGSQVIDISDILGKRYYTSGNGVVFTNGLKVRFDGIVVPEEYQSKEFYVEGVGEAIELVPVEELITPELYIRKRHIPWDIRPHDSTGYDASLNEPADPDYIVSNRASIDRSAWARTNRWFHSEVIEATARYNEQTVAFDQTLRAKRPILEYRKSLQLINYGKVARQAVNIIDFTETDALSNVRGAASFTSDGFILKHNDRIIFAADTDPEVRNKIFTVNIIDVSGDEDFVIDLVADAESLQQSDVIVCLSGVSQEGQVYHYGEDGAWKLSQQKTALNQPPLFDVFSDSGVSYGDSSVFSATSFFGSRLFGYRIGNGAPDAVLKFALKYKNLGNVGDIEFENYLFTDKFVYVGESAEISESVGSGFVHQNLSRDEFTRLTGWVKAHDVLTQRQVFDFETTEPTNQFELDIPLTTGQKSDARVFVNSGFIPTNAYDVSVNGDTTTITLVDMIESGIDVQILAKSNKKSSIGYYEVPLNLERNPFNETPKALTLGAIRAHYQTAIYNLNDFDGIVNGKNNSRDLGNILPYGEMIIQHSAPVVFSTAFSREHNNLNFFDALLFVSQEYEKYKAMLLDFLVKNEFINQPAHVMLDAAIAGITLSRPSSAQFYWSDMSPSGDADYETNIVVNSMTTVSIDLTRSYDFTKATGEGVLVYLNDVQLVRGVDYEVRPNQPILDIIGGASIGDRVLVKEYYNTAGSYIPDTPTKLGLYPLFVPSMFEDDTFLVPTTVIRGHDGSITVAYGDYRDDVLLEFEKRIFNNIKVAASTALTTADVVPATFRTTQWESAEINDITTPSFLAWLSWNKLEYKSQDYLRDEAKTWNYSSSTSKVDSTLLHGHWRGIFYALYDTDRPHTDPWAMLGFSMKPTWWEDTYGPAPYTSTNDILWDDIATGTIRSPDGATIDTRYARPQIYDVIPVDGSGNLRSAIDIIVDDYEPGSFKKSWKIGDIGPTEAAFRRSSSWAFVVQKLLALTTPAKFFALNVDRDRYAYSTEFEQYMVDGRARINPKEVEVPSDTVRKHSYLNWIVDYGRMLGTNGSDAVESILYNLDVRLSYRVGGFTDKQYLKVFTDHSTPGSEGTTSLFPDESFTIRVHKNQPFERAQYSAIMVQRTVDGYAVYGYGNAVPFFETLAPIKNGNYETLVVVDKEVLYPKDYSDQVELYAYGHIFRTVGAVVEFIVGYGKRLEQQGFLFDRIDNQFVLDWLQMSREFVNWARQGWPANSVILLNPDAEELVYRREGAIVDSLAKGRLSDVILNQNKQIMRSDEIVIDRFPDEFGIRSLTTSTISYVDLRLTRYEHIIVFDNQSIFGDVIYEPISGSRQARLRVSGFKTTNWTGRFEAPGFIFNLDNISEWTPNRFYTKGEVVRFKEKLWSAVDRIRPSASFEYSSWQLADYDKIKKGLLPNIATKAVQATEFYNSKHANLERDADLLSIGLIGFKQRAYLSDIGLDDISQVGIYSEFIGTKGTLPASELFNDTVVNDQLVDYSIRENWAVRAGSYGATENRASFEISLSQDKLIANPSIVTVFSKRYPAGDADQKVAFKKLLRHSQSISDASMMPVIEAAFNVDNTLPSAGFASFDDVDGTAFTLDDITSSHPFMSVMRDGSVLWVAKTSTYDWGIFKTANVNTTVLLAQNNYNGTFTIEFAASPNLVAGDHIIIKNFVDVIDGFHEVVQVVGDNAITINLDVGGQGQATFTGTGVCFVLSSLRAHYPADIVNVRNIHNLDATTVWVDDDSDGKWAVYGRQPRFAKDALMSVSSIQSDGIGGFGKSIDIAEDGRVLMVGNPDANRAAMYSMRDGEYVYRAEVAAPNTSSDVIGFGYAMSLADHSWGVIGAPYSDNKLGAAFAIRSYGGDVFSVFQQLPIPPAITLVSKEQLGAAVKISNDGKWVFVAAPGELEFDRAQLTPTGNRILVYVREDFDEQEVAYISDGSTNVFEYASVVQVLSEDELSVVVNGVQQGAENYTIVDDEAVQFNDSVLRMTTVLDTAGTLEFYPLSSQYDTSVFHNDIEIFDFTVSYTEQEIITITTDESLVTEENDRGTYTEEGTLYYQIAVGTRIIGTIDLLVPLAGTIEVFLTSPLIEGDVVIISRKESVRLVGDGSTTYFEVSGLPSTLSTESVMVLVDGVVMSPWTDYEYGPGSLESPSDRSIEFSVAPAAGSDIEVRAQTHYRFVQDLAVITPDAYAQFGSALDIDDSATTLVVGAFSSSEDTEQNAGTMYVFDRRYETQIIDEDGASTGAVVFRNTDDASPITVRLNGVELRGPNFFSAQYDVIESVSEIVIQLNDNVVWSIGDKLTLEFDQFVLIEQHYAKVPKQGAKFGASVAVSATACSAFIGAPHDSTYGPSVGIVERFEHAGKAIGVVQTISLTDDQIATITGSIRINGAVVDIPSTTMSDIASAINDAQLGNVRAWVAGDTIAIGVIHQDNAAYRNMLSVLPSDGNAYQVMGFTQFGWVQTLTSPSNTYYGFFGSAISYADEAETVLVSAYNGSAEFITTFDANTTEFDFGGTEFREEMPHSGVVYSFDFMPNVAAPGMYVIGQELEPYGLQSGDLLGRSISVKNGVVAVGVPGADMYLEPITEDLITRTEAISRIKMANEDADITDEVDVADYGYVLKENNGRAIVSPNSLSVRAWNKDVVQRPIVDVSRIESVRIFDRSANTIIADLDFIDPLRGKILGAVKQNIDYITGINPAMMTDGDTNVYGMSWGDNHLGEVWWDTSTCRFFEYNQGTNAYAANKWAQLFPGSSVDVYQWVSSNQPPSEYDGEVWDEESFTLSAELSASQSFKPLYYFWAKRTTTTDISKGKTLSADTVAQYIESPMTSGIAYAAMIDPSTVALYNTRQHIHDDSGLQIEFQRKATDANQHYEFELITEETPESFLSGGLYNKLLDSFCGTDLLGNLIPSPLLPLSERYGVAVRPKQSMFVNRFIALENYCTYANKIMAAHLITEEKRTTLLYAEEPLPASSAYDREFDSRDELAFQDLSADIVGTRYLVKSDIDHGGRWTISQLTAESTLETIRVQLYRTSEYWDFVHWVLPGFDISRKPMAVITNASALTSVSGQTGDIVKVDSVNGWELYEYNDGQWIRSAVENGTIQISEKIWNYILGGFGFDTAMFDAKYFDQEPVNETRYIIRALNEEIFTGDLLIERNRSLRLMFDYILSEQFAPDWIMKTSLVDVEQLVRHLDTTQRYQRDFTEFVRSYITETKPFHVKFREFSLKYTAGDTWDGRITDFDVPAYYNLTARKYISPILDDTGTFSEDSSHSSDDEIWQTTPWNDWYLNYYLALTGVEMASGGTGYTQQTTVSFIGDCEIPATATASVNLHGQVVSINIQNAGKGYVAAPQILISSDTGTGAKAVAIMKPAYARDFDITLKYDRVEHRSEIGDWSPSVVYTIGDLVKYDGAVYSATETAANDEFSLVRFSRVSADELKSLDRITSYYSPTTNMVGMDTTLLVDGLTYPEVNMISAYFAEDDENPTLLDAKFHSFFDDAYLGTRVSDINVDGAGFVDVYNSHAPQELIPGRIFDTIDIKVHTRRGADGENDGHGFEMYSNVYDLTVGPLQFGELEFISGIRVLDNLAGTSLIEGEDYVVDWTLNQVNLTNMTVESEFTVIEFGVGGGNQLLVANYVGSDFTSGVSVEVASAEIANIVAIVNGRATTTTWNMGFYPWQTTVWLESSVEPTDAVVLVVLGLVEEEYRDIAIPVVEKFSVVPPIHTYNIYGATGGQNRFDAVVELNGRQLTPANMLCYIADDSSGVFLLGYEGMVVDTDIAVFVDNTEMTYGLDYIITPYDFSTVQSVIFTTAPTEGSIVKIFETIESDYRLEDGQLDVFVPMAEGDSLTVLTWNESAEQRIRTKVFTGPTMMPWNISHGFDSIIFDAATSGYDYSGIEWRPTNAFNVGVDCGNIQPDRIWVSVNGSYLRHAVHYTIHHGWILIDGPLIADDDVVVVRIFTDSIVPSDFTFRWFKDKQDVRGVFRITADTTTTLLYPLMANDVSDEIYVVDASKMPPANVDKNQLGIITIGAERIAYRERDTENNVLRGIYRGTAGTAILDHIAGETVLDMSKRNWLRTYDDRAAVLAEAFGQLGQSWYDVDGISLQYTNTYAARFLRGIGT